MGAGWGRGGLKLRELCLKTLGRAVFFGGFGGLRPPGDELGGGALEGGFAPIWGVGHALTCREDRWWGAHSAGAGRIWCARLAANAARKTRGRAPLEHWPTPQHQRRAACAKKERRDQSWPRAAVSRPPSPASAHEGPPVARSLPAWTRPHGSTWGQRPWPKPRGPRRRQQGAVLFPGVVRARVSRGDVVVHNKEKQDKKNTLLRTAIGGKQVTSRGRCGARTRRPTCHLPTAIPAATGMDTRAWTHAHFWVKTSLKVSAVQWRSLCTKSNKKPIGQSLLPK